MRIRAGSAAIAILLAGVVLTGCTAPEAPSPRESQAPSGGTVQLPAGVIVATGAFSDATGKVTGDVSITSTEDATFLLTISGFSSSIATAELSASDEPVTDGQRCFTRPWRMGFGTHSSADVELEIHVDDPSFIAAVTLTTLPEESSTDCQLEYVGYANLTWDIPDLRPDLVVVDSGPADNARGSIELDADGAPQSYIAVEGDRLNPIATRFGIAQDDLRYLNPTHPVFGGSTSTVPAGEVLNLSKEDR
jgi:hypothetical protein